MLIEVRGLTNPEEAPRAQRVILRQFADRRGGQYLGAKMIPLTEYHFCLCQANNRRADSRRVGGIDPPSQGRHAANREQGAKTRTNQVFEKFSHSEFRRNRVGGVPLPQ